MCNSVGGKSRYSATYCKKYSLKVVVLQFCEYLIKNFSGVIMSDPTRQETAA